MHDPHTGFLTKEELASAWGELILLCVILDGIRGRLVRKRSGTGKGLHLTVIGEGSEEECIIIARVLCPISHCVAARRTGNAIIAHMHIIWREYARVPVDNRSCNTVTVE